MRYLSTLLLALHLAAVAYSTPISPDTSGSVALGSQCPSATTLDLRTVHYHKRNLVHFLFGGSKCDKKDKCKGKDAGESSTTWLVANKDKAVDSTEDQASPPVADTTEWTRIPGEIAEKFIARLHRQAKKWREEEKLDEMGLKRIDALCQRILLDEIYGFQDPHDPHGDILKVIGGTWGNAEDLKYGFNLFKRSANNESSNMRALKRPLLHDPNGWIRDMDNIDDYWKPRESEKKTDFTTRIYNLADMCYRHRALDFKDKEILQKKITDLRGYVSIPSEEKTWQRLLRNIHEFVRDHVDVNDYEPGDDRTPNSPPPLKPSELIPHFSKLHF